MPINDDPRNRQRPVGPFRPAGPLPVRPQGAPVPGFTPGPGIDQVIIDLTTRFNGLTGRVNLAAPLGELEDLSGRVSALAGTLGNLRARGYRFGRGWEAQAEGLRSRWSSQQVDARRILDQQVVALSGATQQARQALDHAQHDMAWRATAERHITLLEQQVSQAEQQVRGAFDQTRSEVSELTRQFTQASALLEAIDTAAFKLYPDESGVAACEAQWLDKGEEPKGVLVLTDGRLFFEQKEKKATKKFLFIAAESEVVHKLLFESPAGAVDQVEATDSGGILGFGAKQLLELHFSKPPENAPANVTLRLLGGARNEDWASLIRRVQSGQIEAERYQASAAEAAATPAPTPVANIPTQCPKCGAKLPAYVKGMRQIECEYCGTAVPVG